MKNGNMVKDVNGHVGRVEDVLGSAVMVWSFKNGKMELKHSSCLKLLAENEKEWRENLKNA